MSRLISQEAARLAPYTPGEQPRDQQYIKLNTNESPYPPAPGVLAVLAGEERERLELYSDPTCAALTQAAADFYGLEPEQVIAGNGSDELLSFAFRAFCGADRGPVYADITYGFYKVWAQFYGLEPTVIPLREDFSLAVDDYLDARGTIFIANPNAPTGMALPTGEIRRLLEADRDRLVVIDEAYVDFGAESCVPLIGEYDNLLVIQTFSKSRSLAGGRIGLAMGDRALIDDLNRVKYSFNPYNVNRLSIAAGAAAMADRAYFERCTQAVARTREDTTEQLRALGFTVLPSKANFIFAKTERLGGGELYRRLKERGILVRHFDQPARIADYCRISIGSPEQMEALVSAIRALLEESEKEA
jgi:histidinol-phosphate aminotransferase